LAYRVEIAAGALRDAEEYYSFILSRSHDALPADAWWGGMLDAVYSLENLPTRCPRIPEQTASTAPLYQLIYASHRIIFRIDGQIVRVARIYHSALRPLKHLNQRPKR
jgi:hypothetical protein